MPNRFVPINPGTDFDGARAVINSNFAQLDAEAVSKRFGNNQGLNLLIGIYDGTHFGMLFTDENGIPIQLIGQAPDDGRMGMWSVRPGENVITLLGG
jgi:hypothetical protein